MNSPIIPKSAWPKRGEFGGTDAVDFEQLRGSRGPLLGQLLERGVG